MPFVKVQHKYMRVFGPGKPQYCDMIGSNMIEEVRKNICNTELDEIFQKLMRISIQQCISQ
jgi:hypothetical protein